MYSIYGVPTVAIETSRAYRSKSIIKERDGGQGDNKLEAQVEPIPY